MSDANIAGNLRLTVCRRRRRRTSYCWRSATTTSQMGSQSLRMASGWASPAGLCRTERTYSRNWSRSSSFTMRSYALPCLETASRMAAAAFLRAAAFACLLTAGAFFFFSALAAFFSALAALLRRRRRGGRRGGRRSAERREAGQAIASRVSARADRSNQPLLARPTRAGSRTRGKTPVRVEGDARRARVGEAVTAPHW